MGDFSHDILIIGSGLAGLRAAIECAGRTDVGVVSKVFPTRSHSGAAQGGLQRLLEMKRKIIGNGIFMIQSREEIFLEIRMPLKSW